MTSRSAAIRLLLSLIGLATACSLSTVSNAQTKVDWVTQLKNFPSGCTTPNFVRVIGVTSTCASPFYQTLQVGGTSQTQFHGLNLLQGANITISCANNAGNDSNDCTFTASSSASTQFSALTASTNSNAGTFAASGNSWDFTAATIFKLRTGAGLTASANGDFGFDTTNNNWHGWNGADRLFAPLASGFVSGHCGQPTSSSGKWEIVDAGAACGTGGSTAFSALTASTNSNAGTFAVSGNTWDFTAATLMKLRIGAGLTTSTNGDVGFDTTNKIWHIWQNGADKNWIASSNLGNTGQPCLSNADGSCTFADPIISPNTPAESTAAWTSATGSNSAVTVSITGASGFNTVVVTLNQGSTITGGVVTFEVSDTAAFTNAYLESCWQATTGNSVTSYTLTATTNQAFVCNVASFPAFRVRLSTVISGSATVNVGVQPSAAVSQPSVMVSNFPATQPISGTVTTNPPANASTNVAQWAGSALGAMANYGTSPGAVLVPGVNAFITNTPAVSQSGTWNTRTQDGSGNAITSNSTTTTSTQGLDVNIRSILNTAPTTAGKLDVKGADGDVFVRQATAANLNATVVGTGTFAVQAAQSGNWTARVVGNAGAVVDAAGQNAAAPANWLAVGCAFFTAPTTLTTTNGSYLNCDSTSSLLTRMNSWLGSTAPTVGSKTSANSIPVVVASDQGAIAVNNTQQGTASQNVAQFGGTNVSTGTGAGGAGIPRVTISNDSSLAANQSTNVNQFGGSAVVTGTGAGGAGIPRVTISNDSSLAANQSVNVNQVAGAATGATNPLYTALADGTTGPVAVKAASTGAAAADKSLVVQLSPNQPNLTSALNVALAANQSVNLNQVAGTALGATAVTNFGAAPAAAAVPGVNASLFSGTTGVTNTGGALDVNIKTSGATVPVSGTVTANQGGAPWSVSGTYNNVPNWANPLGPLSLASGATASVQLDAFGRLITIGAYDAQILTALNSKPILNSQRMLGSFNRPITSTADALDVNIKYPAAAPVPSAQAANALTPVRIAALTAAQTVKTSPGNLWGWFLYNPNASACFLDFFNTTAPSLGSTVPLFTIPLPATSAANVAPGQFAFVNFSQAWSVAAVTATGGASTCATGVVVQLSIY